MQALGAQRWVELGFSQEGNSLHWDSASPNEKSWTKPSLEHFPGSTSTEAMRKVSLPWPHQGYRASQDTGRRARVSLPTHVWQTPATEKSQSHREPWVRTLGESHTSPLVREALKVLCHLWWCFSESVFLPKGGAPLRGLITVSLCIDTSSISIMGSEIPDARLPLMSSTSISAPAPSQGQPAGGIQWMLIRPISEFKGTVKMGEGNLLVPHWITST